MKSINNKGITLIALVITIIVMLILVMVTVSAAINGSLFNYAKKASGDTKAEIEKEQSYAVMPSNMTVDKMIVKFTTPAVAIYGDVDFDGVANATDAILVKRYIDGETELSAQALANGDVNLDGQVNGTDFWLIDGYAMGITTLPYTEPILYGDANLDGTITVTDALAIARHAEGIIQLDLQGRLSADVNFDGEITEEDQTIVMRMALINSD